MIIKIDIDEIKNMDDLATQLMRITRHTKWKFSRCELELRGKKESHGDIK